MTRVPVVMIVEDDASMRKLLRVTLTTAGYVVLEAPDARTALTLAEHEMPDLVVQDLILPDSAGFSLVRALRSLAGGDELPIIALSGQQERLDEAWRARGGFTAYLRKPVEPSRLVETVHTYLRPGTGRDDSIGRGRRVLVVDDSPAQGKLIGLQLAGWGFETVVVPSGEAALAEARRERPAGIVSDVLMPDMDGFRLCLEVKSDPGLADVPVILVSAASPEPTDHDTARRVAASGLIMGTPGFWGLREALARSMADDVPAVAEPAGGFELQRELARRGALLRARSNDDLASGTDVGAEAGGPGQGMGTSPRRGVAGGFELQALARLAELLAHRRSSDLALGEALAEASAALGGGAIAVLLCDAHGRLELHGQQGMGGAARDTIAELAHRDHVFAPMWATGGPIVLEPARAVSALDLDALELLRTLDASALSLTPLLAAGTRIGVLVVVHLEEAPGPDRVALVRVVAGLIGQALALAHGVV